jgi:acyl carrier protein
LEILRAILAERSTGTAPTEQLTVHTNWRDLGINSVDFLSFVLAVEKEFSVELPEEDLGGDALVSVDAWSKYLATRRAG